MSKVTSLKQVKQRKISGPALIENAEDLNKLTPKEEAFVVAYLDEDFIKAAAYEGGISERTARRWLAEPRIQAAIERLRQERREIRENRLAACIDRAIDILSDNLLCLSNAEEANRMHTHLDHEMEFKYVSLMLKYVHDQREVDTLKLQIAMLEAEVKAAHKSGVDGSANSLED